MFTFQVMFAWIEVSEVYYSNFCLLIRDNWFSQVCANYISYSRLPSVNSFSKSWSLPGIKSYKQFKSYNKDPNSFLITAPCLRTQLSSSLAHNVTSAKIGSRGYVIEICLSCCICFIQAVGWFWLHLPKESMVVD